MNLTTLHNPPTHFVINPLSSPIITCSTHFYQQSFSITTNIHQWVPSSKKKENKQKAKQIVPNLYIHNRQN